MSTITMLELRRESASVLGRLARGERLILSHRGKEVARLEPMEAAEAEPDPADPFLGIGARSTAAPNGPTDHRQIDSILYGQP